MSFPSHLRDKLDNQLFCSSSNEMCLKRKAPVNFVFICVFVLKIHYGLSSTVNDKIIDFKLVDTIDGNDNIVISVPHGGYLTPRLIPDREQGCMKNDTCIFRVGCTPKSQKCKIIPRRDINAYEIGRRLLKTLQEKGRRPHAVFMLLHRAKCDPNRQVDEACQGNKDCEKVYYTFHNFIKAARKSIRGRGLYLDIHTIRHKANWTELGYRVSKTALNDFSINGLNSSIDYLRRRSGLDLEELIRGNRSLGSLLSNHGYKVIPSPQYPRPGTSGYARGGFNTLKYGSMGGGCVDGIQVEGSLKLRLSSKEVVEAFADRLADSVIKFMQDFDYDKPDPRCSSTTRSLSVFLMFIPFILTAFFRMV